MFRATILVVKIGTIPVKDSKMVQETKAAIQVKLRKQTHTATPLSISIISYWILGTIYQNN
jgi:mRNA deadenylase 3'-5' endonuclease subunit Ccr4